MWYEHKRTSFYCSTDPQYSGRCDLWHLELYSMQDSGKKCQGIYDSYGDHVDVSGGRPDVFCGDKTYWSIVFPTECGFGRCHLFEGTCHDISSCG